jgi:hypothetical protein
VPTAWNKPAAGRIHLFFFCLLSCVAAMYACRLPHLSALSIKLSGSSTDGDLDPVLCQMHVHATALCCLSLQLGTSWSNQTDKCWASLGKMTNLTKVQIIFLEQVRQSRHARGLTYDHLSQLTAASTWWM